MQQLRIKHIILNVNDYVHSSVFMCAVSYKLHREVICH